MVNYGRGTPAGVLRGGRRSRESAGFHKTTAFRGSILGGSDQAVSRFSFVVPLLELILGDLASTDEGTARAHSMAGALPPFLGVSGRS